MFVLSIIFGSLIGFIMFRYFTAKTTEKCRDWLAVGVVTTILCVIVSGGVWAVNAITDNTPKTAQSNQAPEPAPVSAARPTKDPQPRPYCDPSEMPIASVGGGKTNPDNSADPYEPIREDLLSPPAATGRIVQGHDPAIANDPIATDDFDPDSI